MLTGYISRLIAFSSSEFGDAKALGMLRVGEVKLRNLEWLNEDNLLMIQSAASRPPMFYSGPLHEWAFAESYDIANQKLRRVDFGSSMRVARR
jgi:hypothetical protein